MLTQLLRAAPPLKIGLLFKKTPSEYFIGDCVKQSRFGSWTKASIKAEWTAFKSDFHLNVAKFVKSLICFCLVLLCLFSPLPIFFFFFLFLAEGYLYLIKEFQYNNCPWIHKGLLSLLLWCLLGTLTIIKNKNKKYPENSAISTGEETTTFFTFALYATTCFAGLEEEYDAHIFLANLSFYSIVLAVTDADGC